MRKYFGFTLIELLIVLSLAAVLMLFAIPTYRSLAISNRATTQVDQLITAINFARSEAVKHHTIVSLCPTIQGQQCEGEWRDGWLVFTDSKATGKVTSNDQILRVFGALPNKDRLEWRGSRSYRYLQLSPTGGTYGQQGTFIYCTQTSKIPYVVIISQTGRVRTDVGRNAAGKGIECS